MAVILWGKPAITIAAATGSTVTSTALTVDTPVMDSTQLNTERGEKHEANIEGGGNEAVRYDKGKFTLEFEVRFANDRTLPLSDVSADGNIQGEWKVTVADSVSAASAPQVSLNKCVASYEDMYSADEGARRHYYFESVVPSDSSAQITWTIPTTNG